MKKLLSIAAVTVALVSLSSCKKDYTCTCTFSGSGAGLPNQVIEYKDVKKKDAKESCDQAQTTWATLGAACELK
jgi:hypothetical protein